MTIKVNDLSGYSLPERHESGENYTYSHTWEILRVLDHHAGPCKVCDKPMVRLEVKQHVVHNGYRYANHFDFIYAHADGSEHHGAATNCIKSKCPMCQAWGTLVYMQQAYGDLTKCSECPYESYYSIGD